MIENLLVSVVVKASPVELPTLKPEKVIAPAEPLFVTSTTHEPSLAGAVRVNAPPLVTYCNGLSPQLTVNEPVEIDCDVTFAPPVTVCPAMFNAASVALLLGPVQVVLSVPARVMLLLKVSVLDATPVSV